MKFFKKIYYGKIYCIVQWELLGGRLFFNILELINGSILINIEYESLPKKFLDNIRRNIKLLEENSDYELMYEEYVDRMKDCALNCDLNINESFSFANRYFIVVAGCNFLVIQDDVHDKLYDVYEIAACSKEEIVITEPQVENEILVEACIRTIQLVNKQEIILRFSEECSFFVIKLKGKIAIERLATSYERFEVIQFPIILIDDEILLDENKKREFILLEDELECFEKRYLEKSIYKLMDAHDEILN